MSTLPVRDFERLWRRQSEDARQYAYRIIKTCILELLLKPGEKLNESSAAASLEVSRTPVHDTLVRLSRESLVDIIPQKGAFVSKICPSRIEQAVWLHRQLGASMLHALFIRRVPSCQLESLQLILNQFEDCSRAGRGGEAAGLLLEYYRQLYVLAGNMERIWDALQKEDLDLRRLIAMAAGNRTMTRAVLLELSSLTAALLNRDNDLACQIYNRHLDRLELLIPLFEKHSPQYFGQAASLEETKEGDGRHMAGTEK